MGSDMATNPELEYHAARAKAELDLSYRAQRRAAAEAHMRLSALHMDRVRLLLSASQVQLPPLTSSIPPRGH
jgi:hypothetical protein